MRDNQSNNQSKTPPTTPLTTPPTIEQMKAEAKALRAEAPDGSTPSPKLSHCEALEIIARRHGFANWNTARARAGTTLAVADMRIGRRVSGRYLGHRFTGQLRGIEQLGQDAFRLSIQFDTPIDVVRFESFSSFRSRITMIVQEDGASQARLSSGEPHLALEGVRRTGTPSGAPLA